MHAQLERALDLRLSLSERHRAYVAYEIDCWIDAMKRGLRWCDLDDRRIGYLGARSVRECVQREIAQRAAPNTMEKS